MEDKNEEILEIENNKGVSNEEKIKEIKKTNNIGLIIISIIYSFVAIIVVWSIANNIIESLVDGYSLLDARVPLFCIIIFLFPFMLLGMYFGNKNNSLKTSIIVYEVVLLLLVAFFWLSWPSIKSSIDDSCCNEIATYHYDY